MKIHGVHGYMIVRLQRNATDLIDFPEWAFVRIDGGLVPFRVSEESVFQKDDKHLVIGLDSVDTPAKANDLMGCALHLEGKWEDWFAEDQPDSGYLSGFEVTDLVSGKTGHVIRMEEIPGNPLLEIRIDGRSVLVPWQPEFVVENDHQNRKLTLRIPEGLLDI